MVRQDSFISAWALTAQMRNFYGMRSGRTTFHNQLLSHGRYAYPPTKKPLLTTNHRLLRLEWAQRWQNLTMVHWQHVIFGDESIFTQYMGGLEYIVYPVSAASKGTRLIESKLVVVRYTSWEAFHQVTSWAPRQKPHGWALQGHFAKHLSAICQAALKGITTAAKKTPHLTLIGKSFISFSRATSPR